MQLPKQQPRLSFDAFEAVELAVGGAEAGGGHERGEVGAGRVFDDGRQGAFAQGGGEQSSARFEAFEIRRGVFGGVPGVGEALGVVIADDGFLVALGRVTIRTIAACDWGNARQGGT